MNYLVVLMALASMGSKLPAATAAHSKAAVGAATGTAAPTAVGAGSMAGLRRAGVAPVGPVAKAAPVATAGSDVADLAAMPAVGVAPATAASTASIASGKAGSAAPIGRMRAPAVAPAVAAAVQPAVGLGGSAPDPIPAPAPTPAPASGGAGAAPKAAPRSLSSGSAQERFVYLTPAKHSRGVAGAATGTTTHVNIKPFMRGGALYELVQASPVRADKTNYTYLRYTRFAQLQALWKTLEGRSSEADILSAIRDLYAREQDGITSDLLAYGSTRAPFERAWLNYERDQSDASAGAVLDSLDKSGINLIRRTIKGSALKAAMERSVTTGRLPVQCLEEPLFSNLIDASERL